MKKQALREKIYKILKINDATNKASWWNIVDEICQELEKEKKEMGNELYCKFQSILDDGWMATERKIKQAIEDYLKLGVEK